MIVCGHEWAEWENWLKQVEYVFPSFDIPKDIADKYKIISVEHPDKYINILFEYFQKLGILLIEYPERKDRVFIKRYDIKPCDLYQYVYSIYLGAFVNHPALIELTLSAANMAESISIQDVINAPFLQEEFEDSLSEDEIFDILSELPVSNMVNILNRLNDEPTVIQSLKKAIVNKDSDEFVTLCVSNDIAFDSIDNILLSCWMVKTFKESLVLFRDAASGKDLSTIKRPESKLYDPEAKRCLNEMSKGEKALVDYCLNQPVELVVNNIWRNIYNTIVIGKLIKSLCPNIELIEQFNNVISRYSLYSHISKTYTIEKVNARKFTIPVIETFKERYISDLKIPESIKAKKESKDYFDGNVKTWREDIIMKLYQVLVAEGLLGWGKATFYSFMYRMSQSYKPDISTKDKLLKPIAWGGKFRELVSLIYHFHDGDGRIWSKSSRFFCDLDGRLITFGSGCVNQAKTLTPRMDKILNNKLFR